MLSLDERGFSMSALTERLKEEFSDRPALRTIAAAAALIIVFSIAFLLYRSGDRKPVPAVVERPAGIDESAPAAELVVHVAGMVSSPGIYAMKEGSRVADAINAAGGALEESDISSLNLAEKLKDGQKIYIPRVGEPAPPVEAASTGTPVNINTADAKKLQELPGIGPKLAGEIITYRESRGGFKSVDELQRVKGIGPTRLRDIRDLVTI